MRWLLPEPVPYLVAILLFIVALGVSPAPAAEPAPTISFEGDMISALASDLFGHHGLVVVPDESDPLAEAEVEPTDSDGLPLSVFWPAMGAPPTRLCCARLDAPENVLLARVFEVSLAARGPPRS